MRRNERISCACWCLSYSLGVVIPVPNNVLPMDVFNNWLKNDPIAAGKIDTSRLYYITTHGRVVDEVEALEIAFNANQLPDELQSKGKLNPLDLWPRR